MKYKSSCIFHSCSGDAFLLFFMTPAQSKQTISHILAAYTNANAIWPWTPAQSERSAADYPRSVVVIGIQGHCSSCTQVRASLHCTANTTHSGFCCICVSPHLTQCPVTTHCLSLQLAFIYIYIFTWNSTSGCSEREMRCSYWAEAAELF